MIWNNISFATNETPMGIQNSLNTVFFLANGIVNPGTLILVLNSLELTPGVDYSLSGTTNQTVTFTFAPKSTDLIKAWYGYGTTIANGFITEIPVGVLNSSNTLFTLSDSPVPSTSLRVFYNGELLIPGIDFTISSNTFTMSFAPNPTDTLVVIYRTPDAANVTIDSTNIDYHNPIFLYANNSQDPITKLIKTEINLGNVPGEILYHQFKAFDYEDNTLGYNIFNTGDIPGTFSIDSSTGWMTGNIVRDDANTRQYEFLVQAYKVVDAHYQTTVPVYFTLQTPADHNIVWNSNSNLGNLIPGVPSTLDVSASIIQPFAAPVINKASANCSMKAVSATIVNGGSNFSIGDTLTLAGGIYSNAAILTVSNVSATSNSITNINITSNGIQYYTELPKDSTFIWLNPNSNSANTAYNAIITVNFGISNINVLNSGGFYDTALVGVEHIGESSSASATPIIFNGMVQSIVVNEAGVGYPAIPNIEITGKSSITPTNPISYTISSGAIPAGLELLSNGLIVGLPSSQYFALDNGAIFDDNTTEFDRQYTFTVTANIGSNRVINYVEQDTVRPNSSNIGILNYQTLTQSKKTFNVMLNDSAYIAAPKTNLSLEFLLNNCDMNTLYSPLLNESIVPNDAIYRNGDFYFGIAPHVRMLLAYGITSTTPEQIQEAIAAYHQNKTYLFNGLKWAQSTSEGYEVIYIEPLDQFTTTNGTTFTGSIPTNNLSPAVADYSKYTSAISSVPNNNNSLYELFPATTPNMINQLNEYLSSFDNAFLPSWMTDDQPNGKSLGFVPAIPLVYVKPGTGQKILFYLQQAYSNGLGLNSIDAITDRYIWNYGHQQNWDVRPTVSVTGNNAGTILSGSHFTVNVAIPLTYTSNLTPRTYKFNGNSTIVFSTSTSIDNAISIINSYNIVGLSAGYNANNSIELSNTYGCPFLLYDGTNSPLETLGLLPLGNIFANINSSIPAGWVPQEITVFDQVNIGDSIDTEDDMDLVTESGNPIYTEGLTETIFIDVPEFFDDSDEFLQDDEGSIYIKFPNSPFINQSIVSV